MFCIFYNIFHLIRQLSLLHHIRADDTEHFLVIPGEFLYEDLQYLKLKQKQLKQE